MVTFPPQIVINVCRGNPEKHEYENSQNTLSTFRHSIKHSCAMGYLSVDTMDA